MSQDAGLITLIRTTTGWSARFSGDAAQTIQSAFGTDTIPTAFTAEAPIEKVKAQMHRGWPKCLITVEDAQARAEAEAEAAEMERWWAEYKAEESL